MTPLNPYSVQAHYPDVGCLAKDDYWLTICNDRLEFCRGFLQARVEQPGIRTGLRLVRHADGKVLHEVPPITQIGVGMVAGYPTGRQILDAVRRTLSRVRHHEGYISREEEATSRRALDILGADTP
jgi:hypothetical protein